MASCRSNRVTYCEGNKPMISKLGRFSIAVVLLCGAAGAEGGAPPAGSFPLTTHSPESRELLTKTWELDQDEGEQIKAIAVLRKMVKIDPNFGMGHKNKLEPLRTVGHRVVSECG